jgi:hypothetical protein
MGFAKTRQDPPKRLDVVGDRRRRRSRGSDFRVATRYTRVRLGHDIVDITPSRRTVAQLIEVLDGGQPAVLPPSTVTTCPVTKDAPSEARKSAAAAMSAGLPTRPRGTPEAKAALFSGVPVKRSSMPVSVGPGATALTRTPEAATSSAADLVKPSTACLLPA